MNKKDLKNATRKDLLELLMEVYEENNLLKIKNEKLMDKVKKQTLVIYEKDDLAQIEIKMTGVFEVIEEAKRKYLKNKRTSQETKGK